MNFKNRPMKTWGEAATRYHSMKSSTATAKMTAEEQAKVLATMTKTNPWASKPSK